MIGTALRKNIDDLEKAINNVQGFGVVAMSRLRELHQKYASRKNLPAVRAIQALMDGINPEIFEPITGE